MSLICWLFGHKWKPFSPKTPRDVADWIRKVDEPGTLPPRFVCTRCGDTKA